ncbi:DUF2484 family protein [Thalassobius sp. Cn5-15]|jgi:hypothetical protein|uniref:DUF2484 family protein n=1 Tax=Thalassobius sp. Cn5-15 TaxID=2917763 RepID=UPI001EF26F4F|nr:DUF2484 family protein [Thalassobius sp. Cn5-15]MCG7494784.1 DUF2484 family protein [Thalassobius sp. Cn5-15]
MSLALILTCIWFLTANVMAMLPSQRRHWPQAWGLIVCGIPILGFVVYEHGPWLGLLVLAGAMSVLRWPVIFLLRRIKRMMRRRDETA